MLRGIAIFLVLISHYAVWIGEIFHSDLLEYGLGRFGVYGVDLFFVVSGYGLVKSVGKKRINGTFLWKRFKTVYLPYLLIVGLITVYDGGISGMTGWVSSLTGAEYWYIRNILVFYLAFYVVYRLSDCRVCCVRHVLIHLVFICRHCFLKLRQALKFPRLFLKKVGGFQIPFQLSGCVYPGSCRCPLLSLP